MQQRHDDTFLEKRRIADAPWQPGFDLAMENASEPGMVMPLNSELDLQTLKVCRFMTPPSHYHFVLLQGPVGRLC